MKITFFKSPAELRPWLKAHHASATELRLGFYKKHSGKIGITYAEALDEALCFGWIDGVRHGLNETSYAIRFSPRKPKSIWSMVNIKRVGELTQLGLMQPSGLEKFSRRDPKKLRRYAYEEKTRPLAAVYANQLKANKSAAAFFHAQAPWYQRTVNWWIMSAKQEATRLKRLATLIHDSARGLRLRHLTRPTKK
jgi:uncharacterized protein YdeI (YjbR/CyaY-like superfamily)